MSVLAIYLGEERTFEQHRQGFAGKLKHRFENSEHHMVTCPYDDPHLTDILGRSDYNVVIFDIPTNLKKSHIASYFAHLSRYPLVAIFNNETTEKILARKPEHGGLGIGRKPKEGRRIVRISRDEGTKAVYKLACEMAHIDP